ncbi:hypothetical protein B566_EDAN004695 [Ephemera danica]|nr:hypothetical protein B566_EDAN004695 [Ephemera danica]
MLCSGNLSMTVSLINNYVFGSALLLRPTVSVGVHLTAALPEPPFHKFEHDSVSNYGFGSICSETYKSIIHAPANLIICHCVAADLRMSRGAAKDLSDLYPKIREVIGEPTVGSCLPSVSNERTFLNLITKHNSSDKPETSHFEQCIKNLKAYTDANKIDRIAITRLGCGLDLLSWDQYDKQKKNMAEELNAKMSIYPKGTSFINDFNKAELIEFLAQFHFPADSRETLDELRKSATTFIKQKRRELADLGYGDVQDEEADEAIQQQQAAQYRENLEKQKQKEKQVRITRELETEMKNKIERDLRKQIEKEMKDRIEREVTARLKEERRRKPEDKVSSEDSEEEKEDEEDEEDEEKKRKEKEEKEDSKIVTEALVTLVKEMKLSRAHKEYSNIQTLANEIRRWEISFSGNTQESVDNFIDLLLEFKTLKKVPDNTIIALLPEVLKENARSWYFLNRDDIKSWKDLVTKLRQSYRVAGYETKLMKDLFNRTQENTEPIEQYASDLMEEQSRKQAVYYNLRRRELTFETGMLVWRKNKELSDAAAGIAQGLTPKYTGPFQIKKKISNVSYELQTLDGKTKGRAAVFQCTDG